MPHLGCHQSFAKGFLHLGKEALSIAADTFQFFTRSPRGGQVRAFDEADAQALAAFLKAHHFAPIIAHAPYTLNPCAKQASIQEFTREVMAEDLRRLSHLPTCLYNLHPGSHVGQGVEAGIPLIAEVLNDVLLPGQETLVLLETMSGKGSEVGASFEELRDIISLVRRPDRLGVCLDLCHVYCAGYDIVNDLDGVLAAFDRVLGLERLRAVHLNDTVNPLGSRKDRHAQLGEGHIGLEAVLRIVTHPALRRLPFVLETPHEIPGHQAEISSLRTLCSG